MPITNSQSGTRIDEIADGIYRIHTPFAASGSSKGFSFNQYLIQDDQPLLFHTGSRSTFTWVRDAIEHVLPPAELRFIACSHFEADECGAMNELLAVAPKAQPVCGKVNAMINDDAWDRPAVALSDGQALRLGRHSLRWMDAPHLPHGWECGYLMEESTRTLLCGDLFTQPGSGHPPLVTSDILSPSETYRKRVDYFAHTSEANGLLEKLAATQATTLACMHGSAWRGDGAALLRALAAELRG
jgi:flavorubredoxin